MPVDYLPSFIGKMYGSTAFNNAMADLQRQLHKNEKLKDGETLTSAAGLVRDLIASGQYDMSGIHSQYSTDAAVLIMKSGSNKPLFVQRVTRFDPDALQSQHAPVIKRQRGNFITPRYEGLEGGAEPYSLQMLYYLSISLERFVHKCKLAFNWNDVVPPNAIIKSNINFIRQGIKQLHDQDVRLSAPVFNAYRDITRELAHIAWLIAYPEHEPNSQEIIQTAFQKNQSPPADKSKVFTNPNQILSAALRTTLMAISSIILDYQRHVRQDYVFDPEQEQAREINEQRIAGYTAEIQRYHHATELAFEKVGTREYRSFEDPHIRHHIEPEVEKSFKDMYVEIFGDLMKISSMCLLSRGYKIQSSVGKKETEGYSQRRKYGNEQMFGNRVLKIDECIHSVCEMFTIISSQKLPSEIRKLFNDLESAAYVYVGTSAGDSERFTSAIERYDALEEKVKQQAKNMIGRAGYREDMGQKIMFFLDKVGEIVKSKRKDDLAVEQLKERVRGSIAEVALR